MWCLVANNQLRVLSEAGFFVRTYADDVIFVMIVENQRIAVDLMSSALYSGGMVLGSTGDGQPREGRGPTLYQEVQNKSCIKTETFGKDKKVLEEAKYLGLVLDSKLNWSRQLEYAWKFDAGLLGEQETI